MLVFFICASILGLMYAVWYFYGLYKREILKNEKHRATIRKLKKELEDLGHCTEFIELEIE